MDPVAVDVERRLWDSAFSLVCAIAGSSAGLYTLFRMPLMFQLFHPGSFLLALFFCMVLFAWPVVVAELALGQRFRLAAIPALDATMPGGRGIAFSSVIIGSLLSAAYSSPSLALIVSPSFGEVVEGEHASSAGSEFLSGGNGVSVAALFVIWTVAAYTAWRWMSQASLFARIMLPLPLVLWCVLAIFAASVVGDNNNDVIFRFLLKPNSSFWAGRLWANAAGQALLLLQVGTGITVTFGSKAKSVHSVINVSFALFLVAMLYAFFVTVSSAGSMALTSTTGRNVTLAELENIVRHNESATRELLQNAPVILPALFGQAGTGSRVLGVMIYIVAIVVGIFALTLILSSFFSSLADLHVALRSPLTSFGAALVCFAIGAPMAAGVVPMDVIVALDQAVVGTALPVLVCAETLAVAFGGWGGASALDQIRDVLGEDLTVSGKFLACLSVLKDFGANRMSNLVGAQHSETAVGRIVVAILPFFVKLFVPLAAIVCALVTMITFAANVSSGAEEAVYAVVLVVTFISLYIVAAHFPSSCTAAQVQQQQATVASFDRGDHLRDLQQQSGGGGGWRDSSTVAYVDRDEDPSRVYAIDSGGDRTLFGHVAAAAATGASRIAGAADGDEGDDDAVMDGSHVASSARPLPWSSATLELSSSSLAAAVAAAGTANPTSNNTSKVTFRDDEDDEAAVVRQQHQRAVDLVMSPPGAAAAAAAHDGDDE